MWTSQLSFGYTAGSHMLNLQRPVHCNANCQHAFFRTRKAAGSCRGRERSVKQHRHRTTQRQCKCRNSTGDGASTSNDGTDTRKESGRIATTLAGLDALLGVQPEVKEAQENGASKVRIPLHSSSHKQAETAVLSNYAVWLFWWDPAHFRHII